MRSYSGLGCRLGFCSAPGLRLPARCIEECLNASVDSSTMLRNHTCMLPAETPAHQLLRASAGGCLMLLCFQYCTLCVPNCSLSSRTPDSLVVLLAIQKLEQPKQVHMTPSCTPQEGLQRGRVESQRRRRAAGRAVLGVAGGRRVGHGDRHPRHRLDLAVRRLTDTIC